MPKPEEYWLEGARQLDEESLASIYDAFSSAIFRYAFRLLGNEDAAEEIVSETFYRFLRSLGAGGGPEKHLKAYLYRVAHNLIVDGFRRSPPVELSLDDEVAHSDEKSGDPVHKLETSFEQMEVRRNLRKLTQDQRQVIVLKYLEGLSNQEVSDILGKPIGAVKSLQHRALNSLRRMLERDEVSGSSRYG